jgi:hypothetical protein
MHSKEHFILIFVIRGKHNYRSIDLLLQETGAASNTSQPAAAGLLIDLLYMFVPNDEHRLIGVLQSRRHVS